MAALSYQGIADAVAYDYMERHGRASWRDIEQKLGQGVGCAKLKSYWHFHGCRYNKASRTCAEPITLVAVRCRAMNLWRPSPGTGGSQPATCFRRL
jgi:hypothetical protein